MLIEGLLRLVERRRALQALAGKDPGASFYPDYLDPEVQALLTEVEEQCQGSFLRLPVDLLPAWCVRRYDPSQVDGRCCVVKLERIALPYSEGYVFLLLQFADGSRFSIHLQRFVEAVALGHVVEAA